MIESSFLKNICLFSLISFLGSASTFYLSSLFSLPSPISSSICALTFCLTLNILGKGKNNALEAPFYMGTFIGMGGNEIVILVSPWISGALFHLAQLRFLGLGGKLGAMAFVSSLVIFYSLVGLDLWTI